MMLRRLALISALFLAAAPAAAEPTEVAVRVIAKGAKFVGTSMGGARIVLRDAETGAILAEGVTEGSTGDTARIMTDKLDRKAARWTEGAGGFVATLDIDAPTRVRAEAYGPLAQRQAAATATSEQWVVPGRDVTGGDGWLIELPGIAVDILSPAAHSAANGAIMIDANVVLMCGCPLTPGGLWDADGYEVAAMIWRKGKKVDDVPLAYAGTASRFSATYTPKASGAYRIVVFAHEAASGNTGLDETTVRVQR
ncbi:MAG: hypothetical protein AAGJ87_05200 [Pseudomonadota bacterium]